MSHADRALCPICGETGVVLRKWVLNGYGRRYEYTIYKHGSKTHYMGTLPSSVKRLRKGEIEGVLREKICSDTFTKGSFRIGDLKKLLPEKYVDVSRRTMRIALSRLEEDGVVKARKEGRSLYFLATVRNERLDFVIESINLSLKDVSNDGSYLRHVYKNVIRNDRNWPLLFVPYRIIGDSPVPLSYIDLKAFECSSGKPVKIKVEEDGPFEKRVSLKLEDPIPPHETKCILLTYSWPEIRHSFVYSAGTFLKSLTLSLEGDKKIAYNALLTDQKSGKIKDITDLLTASENKQFSHIYTLKLRSLPPFAVVQLNWNHI
ncbi:MAG: BlaI/MecI/CopY family transcriptional regulator [Thermoplasmatales archaeon]